MRFQPLGRTTYLRERLIDCLLESRDGRPNRLGAPFALADGLLLRHGELLALDRVIAEYNDRARHRADLVLGFGRGDVHPAVARRELAHRARKPVERARDAASDQPVEE